MFFRVCLVYEAYPVGLLMGDKKSPLRWADARAVWSVRGQECPRSFGRKVIDAVACAEKNAGPGGSAIFIVGGAGCGRARVLVCPGEVPDGYAVFVA